MNERIPRLAGRAVLLLSALLALVEVGRVGLAGWSTNLVVAIVATLAFMPFHLWHLSYGVRGERPPHSGPTLALIAAINLVALSVIGQPWSFMLAVVATSALIVLRPPWSLIAVAACMAGPPIVIALDPASRLPTNSQWFYLVYSVLFRASIQFALVWLVAAVHQIAASRTALAADAVLEERSRLHQEVRASLERHLVGLRDAGRRARAALGTPGVAEPLVALDRVLGQAADALQDLRMIVADTRVARADSAAAALVRSARARRSPIGRGLATRQAWWTFAIVHAVVLAFPLLINVGAFDAPGGRRPALALLAWLGLVALTLSTTIAVARGGRPTWPVARVLAAVVLSFGMLPLVGVTWETSAWFVGVVALLGLRGKARFAGAAAAAVGLGTWDIVNWVTHPGPEPPWAYGLAWDMFYSVTVSALVMLGVSASARLVPRVAELDAARDALAANAIRSERRRLSRDLHDVLGQSLTAISLKGDLARRLLDADRAAAMREIAELEAVASSLADEIEAVARDEREIAFATEAGAAVDLLRLAGIDVRATLDVEGIAPDASAVLGFAVREGATNILRHADARTCVIHAAREDGRVRLELVNDGATAARAGGTGLQNLADRLAELDGTAAGGPLDGGRFRLRVEVPA